MISFETTEPKGPCQEIVSYIHFNDSSKEPAIRAWNYNPLYKIRPIFDYILDKCKTNFRPSKNISVDDGMIASELYLATA